MGRAIRIRRAGCGCRVLGWGGFGACRFRGWVTRWWSIFLMAIRMSRSSPGGFSTARRCRRGAAGQCDAERAVVAVVAGRDDRPRQCVPVRGQEGRRATVDARRKEFRCGDGARSFAFRREQPYAYGRERRNDAGEEQPAEECGAERDGEYRAEPGGADRGGRDAWGGGTGRERSGRRRP